MSIWIRQITLFHLTTNTRCFCCFLIKTNTFPPTALWGSVFKSGYFIRIEDIKKEIHFWILLWLHWMTWNQSHAPTVIVHWSFKAAASTFAFWHKRQLSDSSQLAAALFWFVSLHTHPALCVPVYVCWIPRSAAVTDLSHGLTSRFDLQCMS